MGENDALLTNWIPVLLCELACRQKRKTTGIRVYLSNSGSGSKNSQPQMGPIGVTEDAVVLFGNGDAQMRDAFVYEGATFDATCGGHASPNGQFHYHREPKNGCVAAAVAGQHSPLLGIMINGVPLCVNVFTLFNVNIDDKT